MKKLLTILAGLSLVLFTSCGAQAVLDDCGCYQTLGDAVKAAEKSEVNILYAVTNEGGDAISSAFVTQVMKSEKFKELLGSRFVVYHLDASQAAFEKTVAKDDADDKAIKAAEEAEKRMNENLDFAVSIGAGNYSPQFYVLSKEGYPICEVYYEDDEDDISAEAFNELVNQYSSEIDNFNQMVAATKTGTKEEQLKAIDNLYETTNDVFHIAMTDLWEKAVSLDKQNKSGLIGKYIYSLAEKEASEYYMNNEVGKSIATMIKAAENKALLPEDVQSCYYLAAYMLSASGSTDIQLIADYLQKSYEAAPDTEIAPMIEETANYYRNFNPETDIDVNPDDGTIDFSTLEE